MLNLLTEISEKIVVFKGQITSFNQEGSIVITDRDGKKVNCFIATLHKKEMPELSVGDTVIYGMDENSEYGYILGSIYRYMPVKNDEIITNPAEKPSDAIVDGQRVVFEAQNEIMLRCGKGSILLKKNGKIVIKGTNVITRARNTNKIKGGTVSIN